MTVKLLNYTRLEVADIAICKCYSNTPHSDKEKVKARINRVANVSKHASVIEHLCICVIIDNEEVALKFKENNFSIVTCENEKWKISTNARALQEIDLDIHIKHLLVPEDYIFLF